jgi:hypothetical protein
LATLTAAPYRGGGPALNDLIGGQVKFFFANGAALLTTSAAFYHAEFLPVAVAAMWLNVRCWRAPWQGGAFQWVRVPTRQPLQPEAAGAAVEETK